MKTTHYYRKYLSHIHDTGFGNFAKGSSTGILEILRENNIYDCHIVDLGCGSGILAKGLADMGYSVTGVDLSPDMVALAKKRVPNADFVRASFYSVDIPSCSAVIATGECFNYLFDRSGENTEKIKDLFKKIYSSLISGGLFIFDFAMPGRLYSSKKKNWNQNNWELEVEHQEYEESKYLTRKIKLKIHTKTGLKQDKEIHRLRLFERKELENILTKIGFIPKFVKSYGTFLFPFECGYGGFISKKINSLKHIT